MRQRAFVILLCPVFTVNVKQNFFFFKVTALSLPIACNPAGHIERLSFQLIDYDFFLWAWILQQIKKSCMYLQREKYL